MVEESPKMSGNMRKMEHFVKGSPKAILPVLDSGFCLMYQAVRICQSQFFNEQSVYSIKCSGILQKWFLSSESEDDGAQNMSLLPADAATAAPGKDDGAMDEAIPGAIAGEP